MRSQGTNQLESVGMFALFSAALLLVWDWISPLAFLGAISSSTRHLLAFVALVVLALAISRSFAAFWRREIRGGLRWAVRQVMTGASPLRRTTSRRTNGRTLSGCAVAPVSELPRDELLKTSMTWSRAEDDGETWTSHHGGESWTLRMNDFPAHDLYSLFVEDDEVLRFNDWPASWIRLEDAAGATPIAFCETTPKTNARRIVFGRIDDTAVSALGSGSAATLERALKDRSTVETSEHNDCLKFLFSAHGELARFTEVRTADGRKVYVLRSGSELCRTNEHLVAIRGSGRADFVARLLAAGPNTGDVQSPGAITRAIDSGVFPKEPHLVLEAAAAVAVLYHLSLGAILSNQALVVLLTEPRTDTSASRRIVAVAGGT